MEKSTFTKHYKALTARLRKLREDAGISQRELAKRLGREQTMVARVETGERRLDLIEFYWYCKALGVKAEIVSHEVFRQCRAGEGQRRRV